MLCNTDAQWLAEHWEQVQEFSFTDSVKNNLSRPGDIRTACRKAGLQWAPRARVGGSLAPGQPPGGRQAHTAGEPPEAHHRQPESPP